jgi:L-alanine-DL-glutamate epimerase-like enolase superfamily enzyme
VSQCPKSVHLLVFQGYRKIQLKIGGDVEEDIRRIRAVRTLLDTKAGAEGLPASSFLLMCDANTGWLQHEALRVVKAVADLKNTYIEQPCLTYRECKNVREKCDLPFIIDEAMDDISMLARIIADNSADAINLKISKVGTSDSGSGGGSRDPHEHRRHVVRTTDAIQWV